MKIETYIRIILSLLVILISLFGFIYLKVKPMEREKYISAQTVILNGEIYNCGSVQNNKDKESLYCTGYNDGYSWAFQQIDIEKQIQKLIK